ncbi:MAG: ABC transporter ATP-binding protein [Oscillospiraceae bacterium]|nr:ABC transporter ATP-binding protein [Oscillospiraceae bacterium]
MSQALMRTADLKVGYGKRCVVDEVDIEALRGGMVCLLGPNGSGKSTILRTLSGMLSPVAGAVYIENINIQLLPKSSLARRMAVVLTDKLQPGLLTAFEIAAMGRHPYTGFFGKLKEHDREVVMDALTSVRAQELTHRYYNELSDGEKQKVMIARALAQEPELIVLDEPTSHLDISHRAEVIEVLARLCSEKGITIIMALHDIDLALKGCKTVLMIKNGEIIAQGPPEQIVREGIIQELYDISSARYDDLLCSLELGSYSQKSALFIIGGAGTGIPVFRALRRAGFGMDCGVLHQSDVDAHVARALCNHIVTEDDFQAISDENYAAACKLMQGHDVIIDTGFPAGATNARNMDLLLLALEKGKKVYTLRAKDSVYSPYGRQPIYCNAVPELITTLGDSR